MKAKPKAYSYVRFSTPEQAKGDSFRRQTEASAKWCTSNDYALAELAFYDPGVSAYQGANAETGALRSFLKAVESGVVDTCDAAGVPVLLVESLDRISRRAARKAIRVLEEIVELGVDVVTLHDNKRYSAESLNGLDFLMAILHLMRAHEESAIKGKRVGAAWAAKRKEAATGGRKLTKKCPAWLEPVLDDSGKEVKSYRSIKEAAAAIREIYELKAAGIGKETIVRRLNARDDIWKPDGPRNKQGGWRKSYVEKILRSRAVIGEYQPHRKENGKRVPVGDPIPGYFPAVIDTKLFNRAQAGIQRNASLAGHGGGRNGRVSNLFGHIARCGHCGGSMTHVNKGKPPRGGEYLQCRRVRDGLECNGKRDRRRVRYDKLEPLLLHFCRGLDPRDLLTEGVELDRAAKRHALEALEGELAALGAQIANLTDTIADTSSQAVRTTLEGKLSAILERQAQAEADKRSLRVTEKPQDAAKAIRDIEELIERMRALEGQERADLRMRLRARLQTLIETVEIKQRANGAFLRLRFRDGAEVDLHLDNKGALRLANDGALILSLDADGTVTDVEYADQRSATDREERELRASAKIAAAMQGLRKQGLEVNPHITC